MSTQRKRKHELIIDGYVRQNAEKCDLDIPLDIALVVFMFYYIKTINIEYGSKIYRKDNTITNIKQRYSHKNVSVIGD